MGARQTGQTSSGALLFENRRFLQVKSRRKQPKNATPVRQRAERRVYENNTLAKAAQAYRAKNPNVYLDSRTLDNYLNSKGYNALEANTFKAYLEYYGATYLRQR